MRAITARRSRRNGRQSISTLWWFNLSLFLVWLLSFFATCSSNVIGPNVSSGGYASRYARVAAYVLNVLNFVLSL
jgi:hypothetical protein